MESIWTHGPLQVSMDYKWNPWNFHGPIRTRGKSHGFHGDALWTLWTLCGIHTEPCGIHTESCGVHKDSIQNPYGVSKDLTFSVSEMLYTETYIFLVLTTDFLAAAWQYIYTVRDKTVQMFLDV